MSDPTSRLNVALEGRYRIERELGEGGMATVYLADDLKHERKVALKVLKPELAAVVGAERFLAEIKTTANLTHPHILPLHDSGEVEGFLFYVMPHVEGESLHDRLDREHQLPVEDAVRIATNLAEALDYAHRQGVIHRDIKPANVLLLDGKPVLSDFGIALAVSTAGGSRLTETAVSLGTPMYMSPEQAAADQDVTGQTDIYSLGCVLYEMLAGDPPHTGPNAQAILSRVLTEDPRPVSAVRRSTPAHVASVTAKALQKLPADRFASGASFAAALGDPSFRWPTDLLRDRGARLVAALATSLVIVTGLALWGWLRPGPNPPPTAAGPMDVSFVLPPGQLLGLGTHPLDISSDGRRIVYVGVVGTRSQLYVRDLDGGFSVRAIAGTERARQPFISPEGDRVGFFSGGEVRVVSVDGGIPALVGSLPSDSAKTRRDAPASERGRMASWTDDGRIVWGGQDASVWIVPADGGDADQVPLHLQEADEDPSGSRPSRLTGPVQARVLPGGNIALARVSFLGETDMSAVSRVNGVVDLTTGEFRRIPEIVGSVWRYVAGGHIAFGGADGAVGALPFDIEMLEVTGPPRTLVADALRPAGSPTVWAASESGTLVYGTGGFARGLVIVDRSGRETSVQAEPRGYRFPRASPAGRWLAVTVDVGGEGSQIWSVDLEQQGGAQPITTEGHNISSSWSPDGSRLAWSGPRGDAGRGLMWIRWPQGGEPTPWMGLAGPLDWLDNGRALGRRPGPGFELDILFGDLASGTASEVLATRASERHPRISPDGAWVAFHSDQTGDFEVYVIPLSGASRPIQVSSGGGVEAAWSRDGSELLYRSGNTIMKVDVTTAPTFEFAGRPEVLFEGPWDFSHDRNWDLLPDGRFIFVENDPNVRREIRIETQAFRALEDGER